MGKDFLDLLLFGIVALCFIGFFSIILICAYLTMRNCGWSKKNQTIILSFGSILSIWIVATTLKGNYATMHPPKDTLIELNAIRGGTIYLKKDANANVAALNSPLYGNPKIRLTFPVRMKYKIDIFKDDIDLTTFSGAGQGELKGGEYLVQVVVPRSGNVVSSHIIQVKSSLTN